MADTNSDPKRPAPPYIAFQTLKTLTQNMKADGVPGRIDKTMLRNFSGAVAGQLMTALKFLGLTDQDGHPTDALRALVEAFGTDTWPDILGGVIKKSFAPIFALNLETATPGQFTEKFGAVFEGEGETLRKAITFFVNAVREAKIPISNYIMKNKKPRSAAVKKRVVKAGGSAAGSATASAVGTRARHDTPTQTVKLPSETLLGLFDPEMNEAQMIALWGLIQFYKMKGK